VPPLDNQTSMHLHFIAGAQDTLHSHTNGYAL
jgi:hypothetical protein